MNVTPGGTQTLTVAGKTVRGVQFTFNLVGTSNTAFVAPYINADAMTVEINLHRFGSVIPIFVGNPAPVFRESAYYSAGYTQANNAAIQLLLAHGASNAPIGTIGSTIDFRMPINLNPGDKMTVKVYFPATSLTSQMTAGSSSLDFNEIDGSGFETVTPRIELISINAGQGNWSNVFKEAVSSICFVNENKTGILTADSCISASSVSSGDGLSINDSYSDLINKRAEDISNSLTEANLRYQTVMIMPNTGLLRQGVKVNLNFQSSNITLSNNFIVARWGYCDPRLVDAANNNRASYAQMLKAG